MAKLRSHNGNWLNKRKLYHPSEARTTNEGVTLSLLWKGGIEAGPCVKQMCATELPAVCVVFPVHYRFCFRVDLDPVVIGIHRDLPADQWDVTPVGEPRATCAKTLRPLVATGIEIDLLVEEFKVGHVE